MTVLEPVVAFLMKYKGTQVTLEKVVKGADRPRKPVLRVMDRLVREGKLVEIGDDQEPTGDGGRTPRNPTWEIIEKPVLVAPRPKRVTVRDRMWRLIRARRRFTRRELSRLSGSTLGSCEDFTKLLEKAGYLRILPGRDGHQKVYMLVKDPGPARPSVKEAKKNHAQ